MIQLEIFAPDIPYSNRQATVTAHAACSREGVHRHHHGAHRTQLIFCCCCSCGRGSIGCCCCCGRRRVEGAEALTQLVEEGEASQNGSVPHYPASLVLGTTAAAAAAADLHILSATDDSDVTHTLAPGKTVVTSEVVFTPTIL